MRRLHKLVDRAIYSGGTSRSGANNLVFTPFDSQTCAGSSLLVHVRPIVHGAPHPLDVLHATHVPREIHVVQGLRRKKMFPAFYQLQADMFKGLLRQATNPVLVTKF